MDFETYIAGVGPEGMNDIYDIKILICYLLDTVKEPISSSEIYEIFDKCGFVDYFAFTTAMSELKKTGHIAYESDESDRFILNDFGKETARELKSNLPASLKDKVVKAALNLIANRKLDKERTAEIKKVADGYLVKMRIIDPETDLIKIEVFAPNKDMAKIIKEQFLKETQEVYKGIIGLLTKNRASVENAMKNSF